MSADIVGIHWHGPCKEDAGLTRWREEATFHQKKMAEVLCQKIDPCLVSTWCSASLAHKRKKTWCRFIFTEETMSERSDEPRRYLSQVHQVGNLVLKAARILTVVLQNEILADKRHLSSLNTRANTAFRSMWPSGYRSAFQKQCQVRCVCCHFYHPKLIKGRKNTPGR